MTMAIGLLRDLVAALDPETARSALEAATVEVEQVDSCIPGSHTLRAHANNRRVLELWGEKEIASIDSHRSPTLFGPSLMIDGKWQAEVVWFSLGD